MKDLDSFKGRHFKDPSNAKILYVIAEENKIRVLTDISGFTFTFTFTSLEVLEEVLIKDS